MIDEATFRHTIDGSRNANETIGAMGMFADWLGEQGDERCEGYTWMFNTWVCPVKSISGNRSGESYDWWHYPEKSKFIARHPNILLSILPEELFKLLNCKITDGVIVVDMQQTKVNFREYESRQAAEEALCKVIAASPQESRDAWSAWIKRLRPAAPSS